MSSAIYIPIEYKELAERLAKRNTEAGKPIFQTYMDLMVFAAMVGYHYGELEDVKPGPEVPTDTFRNRDKDGIVYLLAIHHEKDGDILRENKEVECWSIIQKYAASGLRKIDNWLTEAATDVDGVSTLINRIKDCLSETKNNESYVPQPDVTW